jgi:hypothetical protein
MAYYIVHKANPYFKNGVIIELFEDGFQECEMVEEAGRLRCVGNKGLIYPEREVFPYCIKMLRRGFDDPKLRRKSGKPSLPDIDWDRPHA